MFKYILDFIVNNIKRPHLKKMIEYIVASNMGLRESDLNLLMKNEWDELGFHLLTNMLGEYFLHDPITKQWRIASSTFTNSLLDKEYRLKLLNDIAVIVNGYDVQDEIKKTMGTYYNIMSGRKDFISQAFTKGFLSSDDPKWNIATTTALSDEGFESWLPHCCDSLLPDEQINIIYSYYRSIDFQNASYFLKVIYKQVKKISPESLSIEAAYAYAHIVKEYMLLTKTSGSETIYPDVLEKAIEIYSHCYNINPEYLDTINMYKAMLSEKLVVLGMKGDFLGMKNLYETINNIG